MSYFIWHISDKAEIDLVSQLQQFIKWLNILISPHPTPPSVPGTGRTTSRPTELNAGTSHHIPFIMALFEDMQRGKKYMQVNLKLKKRLHTEEEASTVSTHVFKNIFYI